MKSIYLLAILGALLLTACGEETATTETASRDQTKPETGGEMCGDSGSIFDSASECIATSAGTSICALLRVACFHKQQKETPRPRPDGTAGVNQL